MGPLGVFSEHGGSKRRQTLPEGNVDTDTGREQRPKSVHPQHDLQWFVGLLKATSHTAVVSTIQLRTRCGV